MADDAMPPIRRFATPADMMQHLVKVTAAPKLVRNYCAEVADMSEEAIVVETELFPKDALHFYTKYNLDILDMANPADAELHAKFYTPARGGGQGDYRKGIAAKIDNVVDCLTHFPRSKRAIITIPNRSIEHAVDEDAKCLRELHFYLEEAPVAGSAAPTEAPSMVLSCTGIMRAQAATIFPKNIHYIGTIMNLIAKRLGLPVGRYTHFVTTLIDGRES